MKDANRWVFGLTPGDAQNYINKKYIEYDLYTGKPGTDDYGFIGYNTHNQFLQCLLETGVLGLAIFIFICFAMISMIIKYKKTQLTFTILIILAFCITDTALGTQYGLIIFLLFPIYTQLGIESGCDHNRIFST
jgi:O-antigen ligase